MKIFINGKFLCQKITGVQRYAIEITKELDKLIEPNSFYIICPSKEYMITDLSSLLKNIKIIYTKGKPNYFWEQWTLPRYCKKNKPDDLINFCNIAPILFPGSCTLHDLAFIESPKGLNWKMRFAYKFITKFNIKRYKYIFTVSNTMAEHISKYYKLNKPIVTYNGYEHMLNIKAIKPNLILPESFYLAVGSMNPNKNFEAIIKLAINNSNVNFVVAGGKFKSFNNINVENVKNLNFIGYVSDENLVWLYKNCKAFLFPSKYEGFGIPPLEAYTVGCKYILCNNIQVLREICSNFAQFVEFDNNIDLNKLVSKPKENASLPIDFSWKKSAKILYSSIVFKNYK